MLEIAEANVLRVGFTVTPSHSTTYLSGELAIAYSAHGDPKVLLIDGNKACLVDNGVNAYLNMVAKGDSHSYLGYHDVAIDRSINSRAAIAAVGDGIMLPNLRHEPVTDWERLLYNDRLPILSVIGREAVRATLTALIETPHKEPRQRVSPPAESSHYLGPAVLLNHLYAAANRRLAKIQQARAT